MAANVGGPVTLTLDVTNTTFTMRFSQRVGISAPAKLAQRESIDDELRNALWSVLTLCYWDAFLGPGDSYLGRSDYVRGSNFDGLIVKLWLHHFKEPVDTIDEYWGNCVKRLRDRYFAAKWYEVYDFVEFVALNGPDKLKDDFIQVCNIHLDRENSAYRFVSDRITEITSAQEIEEIEKAISASEPYAGVKRHLSTALDLMSNKKVPDYRNSIKESISAVESLAKKVANDNRGTLGGVLKELERTKKLHPALKDAFSSLYGYTNDANGIRHALLEESNLTKADARFMLVCCSAFVNFAIEGIAK